MNIRPMARLLAAASLCLFAGACASDKPPKPDAKGHWETLPPVTGSMIQRRVWVDDNGNVGTPLDAGSVSGGSKAGLDKVQRTGGSMRRIGE